MLKGMIKTNLSIIKSDSGSVMHVLKKMDTGYKKFGELYFSTVLRNKIKAWKLHQTMTLNLVVPSGRVLFYFIDNYYFKRELDKPTNQPVDFSIKGKINILLGR